MKKLVSVLAVFVMIGCGGTLLADPVSVVFNNVSPGQSAQVNADGDVYNTNSGVYNLTVDGVSVDSYCIDPAPIQSGADYFMIDLPSEVYYTEAAWIITMYGFPTGNEAASNVQLAIWTLIPNMTVTDPNPLPTAVTDMVAAAQAAVGQGWNATEGFALLVSPSESDYYSVASQDFIIRTPEPASIILLGLGLFGVGLVGRKFC